MNVASLDLCKELYELSGWKLDSPRYPVWAEYVDGTSALWYPTNEKDIQHLDEVLAQFPAYDLGYLIRKLPTHLDGVYDLVVSPTHSGTRWLAAYCDPDGETQHDHFADTPEDAVAMLAIELFKQGILTRS